MTREQQAILDAVKVLPPMTLRDVVHYEIYSSWLAGFCGWDLARSLAASYYTWKAKRKFTRYRNALAVQSLSAALRTAQGSDRT